MWAAFHETTPRARMSACARLIALLLLLSLNAACAPSLDAEQGRLCRMLLPALFAEDDGITVLAQEGSGDKAVHVTFRAGEAGTPDRLITCRFGGEGFSAAKRDLVAVQIDGIGIGETQLYFLKARWLESAFAIPADPGGVIKKSGVFTLSRAQALILQHFLGALPRIGILSLLALATALIYGLTSRINLAFGEFAALGGIAMALAVLLIDRSTHLPVLMAVVLALLLSLGMSGLAGAYTGRVILWPLTKRQGQPMLVAGVGLLVFVQEALRLAQGAGTIWLAPVGAEAITIASADGFNVTLSLRLQAMLALNAVAIAGVLALMRWSAFGRAWRASADDPFAASLMGIDPRGLLIKVSALATLLAGLAGATITLNYGGMHFSGGTMLGITGLIAAILGGIGSLGGAVLAATVIGLFQAGWLATRDMAQWELASFALLSVALVLKPGGFFGYADGPERKA